MFTSATRFWCTPRRTTVGCAHGSWHSHRFIPKLIWTSIGDSDHCSVEQAVRLGLGKG
jgi:hypothetical protein